MKRTIISVIFVMFLLLNLPIVSAKQYERITSEVKMLDEQADGLSDLTNQSHSNYNVTWKPFVNEFNLSGSISNSLLPPSKLARNVSDETQVRSAVQYTTFSHKDVMEGSSIQWWRAPFSRMDGYDVNLSMTILRTDSVRQFDLDVSGNGSEFRDINPGWVTGADIIYENQYNITKNTTTAKMQNVEWNTTNNKTVEYNFTYCRSYAPIYSGEDYVVVWQWIQNSSNEEIFVTQSDVGSNEYYRSEIVIDGVREEFDFDLLTDVMHQYGQSSKLAGDNIKGGTDIVFNSTIDGEFYNQNAKSNMPTIIYNYQDDDLTVTYRMPNGYELERELNSDDQAIPLGKLNSTGSYVEYHDDLVPSPYVEKYEGGEWVEANDELDISESEGLVRRSSEPGDDSAKFKIMYQYGDYNSYTFSLPIHSDKEVVLNATFEFYNQNDKVAEYNEKLKVRSHYFLSLCGADDWSEIGLDEDDLAQGESADRVRIRISSRNNNFGVWLEDRNDMGEDYQYTVSTITPVKDNESITTGYVPFHTSQTYSYRLINEEVFPIALPFFMPPKKYDLSSVNQPTTLDLIIGTAVTTIKIVAIGSAQKIINALKKAGAEVLSNPVVSKIVDVLKKVKDIALKIGSFFKDIITFTIDNWEWMVFSVMRLMAMISSFGIFIGTVWMTNKWARYWYKISEGNITNANEYLKDSARTMMSVLIMIAIAFVNLIQIIGGPFI